jgi:hypothetical protein
MSLTKDHAPLFGWKVERVVGKRSIVRLVCPVCAKEIRVRADNIREHENGSYAWQHDDMDTAHVLKHSMSWGLLGSAGESIALLIKFAGELDNMKAHGVPAEMRKVLELLAKVLRPYAPEAADALEAPSSSYGDAGASWGGK